MVVNIIHNEKNLQRFEWINKTITEHNLEYKFWPAIFDPRLSFMGISRAHKQIVQDAKDKGLPCVCIAEDDMYFTSKNSWQYFLDNIPMDYDLYLSGIYCGKPDENSIISDFCGLHLYIVNQRFYDKFLSVSENQHLDRGMKDAGGKYVVCIPTVAKQYDGWSENKGIMVNNDEFWEMVGLPELKD